MNDCHDCEQPTNKTISKELIGVLVVLLIQSFSAIWWASGVNRDVEYLMNQANEGERYTLDRGTAVEARVNQLEIFQARSEQHISIHEENAQRWIDQIEENTRVSRENNAMLRAIMRAEGIK